MGRTSVATRLPGWSVSLSDTIPLSDASCAAPTDPASLALANARELARNRRLPWFVGRQAVASRRSVRGEGAGPETRTTALATETSKS